MLRKFSLVIIGIFMFMLIFPCADATRISLSPPKYVLPYEPGTYHELKFVVRSSPGVEIGVGVTGDLREHVIKTEDSFIMGSIGVRSVIVGFEIPELTKPGEYETKVLFQEKPPASRPGVSALVTVGSVIRIRIPYPDKYLDVNLDIKDTPVGEPARFSVDLKNYGSELISRASGTIDVLDPNNNTITTLTLSEETEIAPNQDAKLTADWSTIGVKLGKYRAIANVDYDGEFVSDEKEFRIGDMLIEITGIGITNVTKDTVAKVPIHIKSKWGEPIRNVYGVLVMRDKDGTKLSETATPSMVVDSWASPVLQTYWDTSGLEAGIYDAMATVYYADKSAELKSQIEIIEPKLFTANIELIFTLMLIILIFILGLAYYRKKRKRKYGGYGYYY